MSEQIRVLLSEEELDRKIAELGERISKDYEGESVHLICILKGSIFFTCELAKRITVPVTIDFMCVSSYGASTVSCGKITIKKDLEESIEGRNVIVIEDIIDTGRTLRYLLDDLSARGPKSLKLCAMLDKPDRRITDVAVDYTGFEIPDEFVNQGEPYPRSKCKPIIDLPPEQFDRVLAIYKELPDDLLEHLIRGEEQEDA